MPIYSHFSTILTGVKLFQISSLLIIIHLIGHVMWALHKTKGKLTDEQGENSEKKENPTSTNTVLQGKGYCGIIALTILMIVVLVMPVAYLGTAGCLIEPGGKLESQNPK